MFNSTWYNSLSKPLFAPMDSIFAPAWAILYITVFISLLLYIKAPYQSKKAGYVYFIIQLVLNLLWTPIFFGLKNIPFALVDIILLDIFTILTIKKFYTASKASGLILLPYFLWLIYATYLNFGYLVLNQNLFINPLHYFIHIH